MSGQFYAVYSNSYQWMSTKPMLKQAWATGELIDQLAAMRQAFGHAGLAGSTPPLATGTQPTDCTVPATILQTDQANGAPHNE